MYEIEPRMLTTEQACRYTGMRPTFLRRWGEQIGARRKFGRMLRWDKVVIDQNINQAGSFEEIKADVRS